MNNILQTDPSDWPEVPPPVEISAGGLDGLAFWDDRLQTFVASLGVFPLASPGAGTLAHYPPTAVRHGTRFAQFITSDALANHLVSIGLTPDPVSLQALCGLGQGVSSAIGDAEFVGFTVAGAGRHLYLRTPSGVMLGMRPRFDHPDHGLCWGDTSEATVETARLLAETAWVRPPAADIEIFALALTYEHLSTVGADFSLSAPAVCDWFLTDSAPNTTLDAQDRSLLRLQAGFTMRQDLHTPDG